MSLTGKLTFHLDGTDVRAGDFDSGNSVTELTVSRTFASGVGLNQADLIWADSRVLTTAATEDIDVVGGLTNIFGAVTPARIKGYVFEADAANTTTITVSRPAVNGAPFLPAASDAFPALVPGGFFAYYNPSAAGLAVTAGTADLVTITNAAGASATYRVGLLMASA